MDWYHLGLSVAGIMLVAAFAITTWRILAGPNSLDRLIALDAFIAMMQCALAVYVCWSLNTSVVSPMLIVALLGFIATLAVTRFRRKDPA
ncbi:monovalent cation/H+ antiporter complex subunit F [uncultured Corynebacterium sp.]|uniref:monovalent cation/H+ antiporter complex subunit F n=1 Tax=uncultured Corynebacterium sp. TaxID=159447 RepID=UPI0025DB3B59|nr:monovalent cation/H+ antiporter complex subunit F [uncultured Corynebacterium sp.]